MMMRMMMMMMLEAEAYTEGCVKTDLS